MRLASACFRHRIYGDETDVQKFRLSYSCVSDMYSLRSPLRTSSKLEDSGNFASFELSVCQETAVLGLCHGSFGLYVCII